MADFERARLLLHWVNSLPLTTCLLVDDLADLRFGDMLADIAHWVQYRRLDVWGERLGDSAVLPAIDQQGVVERVRAVVQLAASECRSVDGDAVFVLNSADCVARVIEGDCAAIGAVLGIFKRLSHQLPPQPRRRSSPTAPDQLRALQAALVDERAANPSDPNQNQTRQRRQALGRATSAPSPPRAGPSRSSSASGCLLRSAGAPPAEATQPKAAGPDSTAKKKRAKPKQSAIRPRSTTLGQAKRSPSTAAIEPDGHDHALHDASRVFRDDLGLHVFGMLDPRAKSKDSECVSKDADRPIDCDDDLPRRVCRWVKESLGIDAPFANLISATKQHSEQHERTRRRSSRRTARMQAHQTLRSFQDGVLLCQIAAAALRLADKPAHPQHPATLPINVSDADTMSLRGCERNPRRRADSIRNVALASAVFRRLGVSEQSLAALGNLGNSATLEMVPAIWRVLDELLGIHASRGFVLGGIEANANAKQTANTSILLPHSERQSPRHDSSAEDDLQDHCSNAMRSRAYVTPEQCAVVDDWLSSLGFNVETNRRGVLQDVLCNGVLLCSLRVQEFPHKPSTCANYKTPRSLAEARENIATVLRDISDLLPDSGREGYAGTQAIEDILLGDRQVIYGLLWHLWQLWKARLAGSGQGTGQNESSSGDLVPTSSSQIRPTPIVLDVPAATLADEDDRLQRDATNEVNAARQCDTGTSRNSAGRREIAWDPETSDDGDIFPTKSENLVNDASAPDETDSSEPAEGTIPNRELLTGVMAVDDCRAAIEALRKTKDRQPLRPVALHTLKRKLNLRRLPSQVQVNHQQLASAEKHADTILQWLKGLNIPLERPDAFQDPSAALSEFQSGVLLCRIAEKVEYMRGIPGVIAAKAGSISRASALHNIKKALGILQHKKTMPLHLMRRASTIYKGDRGAILCLLMEIRKAYGHHLVVKSKPLADGVQQLQGIVEPTLKPQHEATATTGPSGQSAD